MAAFLVVVFGSSRADHYSSLAFEANMEKGAGK